MFCPKLGGSRHKSPKSPPAELSHLASHPLPQKAQCGSLGWGPTMCTLKKANSRCGVPVTPETDPGLLLETQGCASGQEDMFSTSYLEWEN